MSGVKMKIERGLKIADLAAELHISSKELIEQLRNDQSQVIGKRQRDDRYFLREGATIDFEKFSSEVQTAFRSSRFFAKRPADAPRPEYAAGNLVDVQILGSDGNFLHTTAEIIDVKTDMNASPQFTYTVRLADDDVSLYDVSQEDLCRMRDALLPMSVKPFACCPPALPGGERGYH